jgi:hypothetical protein
VHPKVASERLGHSKVGITLDLYRRMPRLALTKRYRRLYALVLIVRATSINRLPHHGP